MRIAERGAIRRTLGDEGESTGSPRFGLLGAAFAGVQFWRLRVQRGRLD